jgi:hypothetical protein
VARGNPSLRHLVLKLHGIARVDLDAPQLDEIAAGR